MRFVYIKIPMIFFAIITFEKKKKKPAFKHI